MIKNNTKVSAEKKTYLSLLSILSSFAVVMLHVNAVFWKFSYEKYWISANIIEAIAYFAVPIFFMVSGATLIEYRQRYDTRTFFKKRFKRTLIPFVFWSILAFLWIYIDGGIKYLGPRAILQGIINTEYVAIFWFFPALFALYLAIPILSSISNSCKKEVFKYIIVFGSLINIALPLVTQVIGVKYNNNFIFPITGYTIYAVVGYYIDKYNIDKKKRLLLYIAGIIGLLIHIIGTQILSYSTGDIDGFFKGYLNLPCFLYSISIFTLFKNIKNKKTLRTLMKYTSWLSPLTYGIYLIQWFVLTIFFRIDSVNKEDLMVRLIATPIIYLLCAVIVLIIKRIPIIKETV